jgi:NAD(P)-dependent dehydrogenase (short-subunit alcohol dehydrogenase family)
VEDLGRECLKIAIDVGDEALCGGAVDQVVAYFGKLDILVNNAAEQHPQESLEDLTEAQLLRTFQANVFSMFYLTKAALPHLDRGARIINTTSVAAYRGNSHLLDFAATNGAIVAFTRSLSLALVQRGILVNGVAAGPVATAPISSTLDALGLAGVGADTPMQRAAQPDEIAACYYSSPPPKRAICRARSSIRTAERSSTGEPQCRTDAYAAIGFPPIPHG